MPYYLSEYIGGGTSVRDPCRPVGSDERGWGAIDLRADGGATPDGNGLNACLLWAPSPVSDPRAALIGFDKDEALGAQVKNAIAQRLGRVSASRSTLGEVFGDLLIDPPVNGWRATLPVRGQHEVYLGGVLLYAQREIAGGSVLASDAFTRANETPIAAPWTVLAGSGQSMNLASNRMAGQNAGDGDTFYYYSGPTWGADQYSQLLYAVEFVGSSQDDFGPAVRVGSNGFSGYFAEGAHTVEQFLKFVAGTPSTVATVTVDVVVGNTVRIEAQGTTLRYLVNGSAVTGSPTTDTSLTTAGNGAGVFIFADDGAVDDFEAGDFGGAAWGPLLGLRNNRLVAA